MSQVSTISLQQFRGLEAQCLELTTLPGVNYADSDYDNEFTFTRRTPTTVGRYLEIGHTIRVAQARSTDTGYESLLIELCEKGYVLDEVALMFAQRATFTVLQGEVAYSRNEITLPMAKKKVPKAARLFGYDPHYQDFADWNYELTADHSLEPEEYELLSREIRQIAALD